MFLILIFKYSLPSFVVGYLLYAHSKFVYEKFDLLNQDDVSQVESSMTMGQLEINEEEKEINGRRRDVMYEEGLQDKSTFWTYLCLFFHTWVQSLCKLNEN